MSRTTVALIVVATVVGGCRIGFDLAEPDEIEISNSGCEAGTTNWLSYAGVVSTSTTARSGSYACQVCCSGADPFCTLDDQLSPVANPTEGDTYYAEAWVRAVAGGTLPRDAFAIIREWVTQDSLQGDSLGTRAPLSDASWTLVSVTKTVVGSENEALDFFVSQQAAGTSCFLVDDLRLFRVP